MNGYKNRMRRRYAVSMEELIKRYIIDMKISSGLNTQLIFKAWDEASGASPFTIGRFFKDGKLYVTLSSSMVRNQLYYQKSDIVRKINSLLDEDPLFFSGDKRVSFVKEIILK